MEIHANPPASEGHAFHLQAETLFPTLFARQCDSATGGHHAMPR